MCCVSAPGEVGTEFGGNVKEAVRPTIPIVVDLVGVAEETEVRKTSEPLDWKASVHQPIVEGEVEETEGGHPQAPAVGKITERRRSTQTTIQDEPGGYRRMGSREYVVEFETTCPGLMVAPVDGPQGAMPNPTMKEFGPKFHKNKGYDTACDPEYHRNHGRRHRNTSGTG